MRFSVVLTTRLGAPALRKTLCALARQTYEDFEVIVVRGPSDEDTGPIVEEFGGAVRVVDSPEMSVGKLRNLGIAASSSEVVAFLDEALPEPTWLADLAAAYDSERVAAAGGIVCAPGASPSSSFWVSDRTGCCRFDCSPPLHPYLGRGAEPFVVLPATNMSFRRCYLVEAGGFDEELEGYLDNVEVCMRVIDLGHEIWPLAGAPVHSSCRAGHLPNCNGGVRSPYAFIKDRFYFALQNGRQKRPVRQVLDVLLGQEGEVTALGKQHFEAGRLTAAQYEDYLADVDRGVADGIRRGLHQPRRLSSLPPPDPCAFLPFPVVQARGRRLKICFVSQEYPPHDFGGIGRYTADLATGFAAHGHDVHVVTRSGDDASIDLENDVWVHRLPAESRWPAQVPRLPVSGNLDHLAAVYHEVCRIHAHGRLDLVSAPLWLSEGLICSLDPRFGTVLTLMTSVKTVLGLHRSWGQNEHTRQLEALERAAVTAAQHIHAISHAILEKVRDESNARDVAAFVAPLGVRDRRSEVTPPERKDGRVRVLFVGRLERRKGVDVLLRAAVALVREFPQVEFILAGKDTPNTETALTYRQAFERQHAQDPRVATRVTFVGSVSEEALYQLYADCDVFCLPSRYESFGLVLVEAMAFGKPVVACATGGMKEIVEEGANGFLAAPGDAVSLADALRPLIENAALRGKLGERSRRLFEEKYALAVVVENTLRHYAEIAATHRATMDLTAQVPAPQLVEALGQVIAEIGSIAPQIARTAAASLLTVDLPAAALMLMTPQSSAGRPIRLKQALTATGRYLKRLMCLPLEVSAFALTATAGIQAVYRELLELRDLTHRQGQLLQQVAKRLERQEQRSAAEANAQATKRAA